MLNNLASNYLRLTSVLQIKSANSGHPGVCLGAAPIAFSIYKNAIVDCKNPTFFNRDRVVFSAGHASALVYSTLHLFGFDVSLKDLKNFRQLNSITSGHPEVDVAPGVDVTTGPLGQGIANAVGFAIAEEYLRNKYKKENFSPIDHYTYCFTGDGCLMEGIAQEAISIAGNLKLNKLILLYDKNDITIDGNLSLANTEDTKSKFIACNWNVFEVEDGNDFDSIEKAIQRAKQSDKPNIIIVKTKIGFGSDLVGSNKVHGKPLNEEQINNLRQNLNYFVPDWEISKELKDYITNINLQKKKQISEYQTKLLEYSKNYPELYEDFTQSCNWQKIDLSKLVREYDFNIFDGREEGHKVLNEVAALLPNLIGGCADVASSTKCVVKDSTYFTAENRLGRNIPYGIREHAMAGISNGISLHKGTISFCSTFFAFANYLTPSMRLSALMSNPVLYLFTHDSISVGEDGPTHQSTEQVSTIRSMPGVYVCRPSGRNEILATYQTFFNEKLPVAVLLPRQQINVVNDDFYLALKGAYIISEKQNSVATIIATGSEVSLAIEAQNLLDKKGINVEVVSMPCVEVFEQQPENYKEKIINKAKPIFCVEASTDNIWYKYATNEKCILKLNSFGLSGKPEEVLNHFGFTPNALAKKIEDYLKNI